MKRILFSVVLPGLVVLLLIFGCASIGGVKEPSGPESTLLIGRITAVFYDFPRDWHVNGEHTGNITIFLRDSHTGRMIEATSRQKDGLFYVVNLKAGRYNILAFEIKKTIANTILTSGYRLEDTSITIKGNSVNNMGDIVWTAWFKEQDERGGGSSWYSTVDAHEFVKNYIEIKTWFRTESPESGWNLKDWVDVQY